MVLRNDDEQIELVRFIGSRMQNIKDSIPTPWTKDETRLFAEGTANTLLHLANEFLPEATFGEMSGLIDSEMKEINKLIYRK
jgi:hypothetical protein